jgi:hemin uptake protein HemP
VKERDRRLLKGPSEAAREPRRKWDSPLPIDQPRIQSSSLFGGGRCLVIEHGQQEYRLQITRMGKLILTK